MFASHFATWDAAHYLYLSEVGYHHDVPSCAFYPLWPLLVRWCAPLAGGSHLIAGLVLSNLFSLAAWAIFYQRVRRRWGKSVAGWALVFLVVFPGSLFFQFLYSESLFFLLVMLLWWGLEERRWGLAWGAALLLPLTRAVGVFAVLPIGWEAAREGIGSRVWGLGSGELQGSTESRPTGTAVGSAAASPYQETGGASRYRVWRLLAAPVIGWGVYLALMWHWTGHPFEGFAAQKSWGVHSVWNLVNVPKFVVGFFNPTEWHEFTGSLLDRCVFVVLLYTLPVLWRLDKGLLVWTYWLGILPAMSGTFTSYTRFASCAFPVFIALGAFFGAERRERKTEPTPATHTAPPASLVSRPWPLVPGLKWALLAGFAALHIVLVWRFVNFRWAG